MQFLFSKLNWPFYPFNKQIYNLRFVEFNVLEIIYFQTIAWTGFFFSPPLIIMSTVILTLTYYLKAKSAILNLHEDSKKRKLMILYDTDWFFYYTSGIAYKCVEKNALKTFQKKLIY